MLTRSPVSNGTDASAHFAACSAASARPALTLRETSVSKSSIVSWRGTRAPCLGGRELWRDGPFGNLGSFSIAHAVRSIIPRELGVLQDDHREHGRRIRRPWLEATLMTALQLWAASEPSERRGKHGGAPLQRPNLVRQDLLQRRTQRAPKTRPPKSHTAAGCEPRRI